MSIDGSTRTGSSGLPRAVRMRAPVATLAALGAATLALRLRDPHVSGSWGFCPTAALGFACPGCGGLRAVNDLTHLDLAAAASSNLAFVVALPFLVLGLGAWTLGRWQGRPVLRVPRPALQRVGYAAALALAAFTLLRNVPGSWLAP